MEYCKKHKRIKLLSEEIGSFCEDCGQMCSSCGEIKFYCPKCREISEEIKERIYQAKIKRERKNFFSAVKRGEIKSTKKTLKDGTVEHSISIVNP